MNAFRTSTRAASFFLSLLLLCGGVASADSWVSVNSRGDLDVQELTAATAPQLTVTGYDESGVSMVVETAGFMLQSRQTKGGEFVVVTWPDASIAGGIGAPGLPVIRELLAAPPGASVMLSVREGQFTTMDCALLGAAPNLLPVQPPIPKIPGARENAPFVYDESAYGVDADVLGNRAVVEELGIVHGQRLFLLEIRPLDYNPVTKSLTFWPRIEVDVDFAGIPGPASQLTPLPRVNRILLNPAEGLPGTRGSGNYLIIVASVFEADIAPFAAAKAAQGFTVTTHSVAAGTSNTVIKSYIQSLWGDPGTAPAYILLVGDTDRIPHWVGGGEGAPSTDLQYACMDGSGDWYPDIAIGRFPVDTTAELQTMVDKTLYYENGPLVDPAYKKRAVFMASVDNYQITEGTHEYVIDTYLEPSGYEVDRLYQVTYGATTQDVTNSFNDGRFYGIYSGHGGTYSWADGPPFSQANVNALTNQGMYAMICSFACITGTYTVDECFMETWVLAPNKGAVTSWGSSVNSYWDEDDILERRLFDAIFDTGDDVRPEIGPIYNEAKMRHLSHYGPTSTTRRYFEMYNLMGDPSLLLPTSCPDAGEMALDGGVYRCEDTVHIEVNDCGLNLDDNQIDTVQINVKSDSQPAGVSVTLYETEAASSEFRGSVVLSATSAPGVLLVSHADTITATYIDASDGQGGTNVEVTATAAVDCQAPQISNVQVTDIGPRRATVAFETDEPVVGTVLYGLSCGAWIGQGTSTGYAVSVAVELSGLADGVTYFYAVAAEDQAGNAASDNNGGACYSFTTPVAPKFFAELFGSDNDLDNTTLLFRPNGSTDYYSGCAEPITALPTDPAGGTVITLTDDDFEPVSLGGGYQVSLYGTSYSTFYVGSNGYITFGQGDDDYSETLAEHFAMPRISALFDDLDSTKLGEVSWKLLEDRVAVTWLGVPLHNYSNPNTFQIEMCFDGRIRISYLAIAVGDGLAGLSEGAGLDPEFLETNLSAMNDCLIDCNGNGVDDSEDLAAGTSQDVNLNGIPDECEPDCNGNGVPDDWDIQHATSPDCNANQIPDECDIADQTSSDDNGNGIPDECELEPPTLAGEGCRCLAVTPHTGVPAVTVALVVTSPEYPCLTRYIGDGGLLTGSPVYRTAGAWGIVHVYGGEIVPGTTYEIRTEMVGGVMSPPATATTMPWGDTVGTFIEGAWTPADGAVDFNDISAAVDAFQSLPTAPPRRWCDVSPAIPNGAIDFEDIGRLVDAFKSLPYPFSVPECP